MIALFTSMLILGLVTSVHCISMCGPMVMTYAVGGREGGRWRAQLAPNIAYQSAKITSYVAVGLLLGAIGSAFSIEIIRPYVMLGAGFFMIVMGLGMTGKAPWAARLVPRAPRFLTTALAKTRRRAAAQSAEGESSLATPVTFGLLTGLMPCAPLIAAELAAAGSGSAVGGGVAMFAFGLGTAPLMLAFGTASSMIGRQLRERVMVALAVVVIVLGVVYVDRAAMRLGSPVTFAHTWQALAGAPRSATPEPAYTTAADGVVEIPLAIQNTRFVPSTVQIPADKPVRLVVDRQEDNACSAQLAVPQLGVLADLAPNAVTKVSLPAAKAGRYTLTCGMGMMSGELQVGAAGASATDSPWLWALVALLSAGGALWLSQRAPRTAGAGHQRRNAGGAPQPKRVRNAHLKEGLRR